jgi:hypothetical protein
VLTLMLDGKLNKSIAIRLGIALRTVEARRKYILEKMGTRSLPEIAAKMHSAGVLGHSALPVTHTSTVVRLARHDQVSSPTPSRSCPTLR